MGTFAVALILHVADIALLALTIAVSGQVGCQSAPAYYSGRCILITVFLVVLIVFALNPIGLHVCHKSIGVKGSSLLLYLVAILVKYILTLFILFILIVIIAIGQHIRGILTHLCPCYQHKDIHACAGLPGSKRSQNIYHIPGIPALHIHRTGFTCGCCSFQLSRRIALITLTDAFTAAAAWPPPATAALADRSVYLLVAVM